jgi:hypothetical protein
MEIFRSQFCHRKIKKEKKKQDPFNILSKQKYFAFNIPNSS